MLPVVLDDSEMRIAVEVGVQRQLDAIKNDRKDRGTFVLDDYWTGTIEGSAGELVVAKFLDRYWSGNFGDFKADDVGPYQVRWTRYANGHLLVHDFDKPHRAFILVTGLMPKYRVHGWRWGRDAQQKKYWSNPTGKRWAFWVPQADLHPMTDLPFYQRRTATAVAAKIISG